MKTDHDEWVVIWTDLSVEDVIELADYIIVIHRVMHKVESNRVAVLAIIHFSKDLKKIMEKE